MSPYVTRLNITPIKGLRLTEVEEIQLTPTGAIGDRAFCVTESDGTFAATVRNPRLVQIVPRWEVPHGVLELSFADGTAVTAPVVLGARAEPEIEGRRRLARVVEGPFGPALSAHLGRSVRLIAFDESQMGGDDCPVTIMSRQSLLALEAGLGETVDPRRFRMTIEIDGSYAWDVESWVGRDLSIGGAKLQITEPTIRCAVTTRDPDDGSTDLPVLKALAKLHGKRNVMFGACCEVRQAGRVRLGDRVTLG